MHIPGRYAADFPDLVAGLLADVSGGLGRATLVGQVRSRPPLIAFVRR